MKQKNSLFFLIAISCGLNAFAHDGFTDIQKDRAIFFEMVRQGDWSSINRRIILPDSAAQAETIRKAFFESTTEATAQGVGVLSESINEVSIEKHDGYQIAKIGLERRYRHPMFPSGVLVNELTLAARKDGEQEWKYSTAPCLTKGKLQSVMEEKVKQR